RQHLIAASGNIEKIEEPRKMLRHLKQPQSVSERSGVDHHRPVLLIFKRAVDSQQRSHLCHAGQSGIEQRFDLFAAEDGPALDDGKNRLAIALKELAEFVLSIDLPHPEFFLSG